MNLKRPLLWISLSFVAGIFSLAVFGVSKTFIMAFVTLCALLLYALRKRNGKFALWSVFVMGLFFLGVMRYGISDDVTQKPLYDIIETPGVLTGEVLSLQTESEKSVRFYLNAESFETKAGKRTPVSGKVYVSIYCNDEDIRPSVNRGDIISTSCEISVPNAALNRGGFDYRQYLKTKSVFFTASGQDVSVISHKKRPVKDAYFAMRTRLLNLFDERFPKEEASLLKAYILGDMQNADPAVSESFSKSGLTHALAVSGMHVVVFLSILASLLKLLHISKRKQLLLSVFLVAFFIVFTGAQVSAIRAGIASILAVGAQLFYRRSDPITALSEAAAIICAFEPYLILNVSFQLSFGATLGILLFSESIIERMKHPIEALKGKKERLWRILNSIIEQLAVGLSAQVFVIPIMVYQFQTVSLSSIIATVAISPFLTPALAGGLLFCAVGFLGDIISIPVAGFLFFFAKAMNFVSDIFAAVPFASISFGIVTPFILLLYTFFILIVTFSCFKRKRTEFIFSVFSMLCLLILFFGNRFLNRDVVRLSFINVGQGDCALIKAPGNCDILIDAGGKEGDTSVGVDTVRPYLLQSGVYDIEYAVISHGHIDHLGGMLSLMDEMEIKQFVVPNGFGRTDEAKTLLRKAKEKNIPVSVIDGGDAIDFQNGMKLSCILPDTLTNTLITTENENNHSAVIKFSYGNTSVLFTGDVEKDVLNYLAENYKEKLSADILKVPHHGAKTSKSEEFLSFVNPTYAVIPVGKNMYGHPNKEVLNVFLDNKVTTYRTDTNRDITFYIDTQKIKGIVTDETGVLK